MDARTLQSLKDTVEQIKQRRQYRLYLNMVNYDTADSLQNSRKSGIMKGDGGPLSGNYGHEGRPGKVGGSAPSSGNGSSGKSSKASDKSKSDKPQKKKKAEAKATAGTGKAGKSGSRLMAERSFKEFKAPGDKDFYIETPKSNSTSSSSESTSATSTASNASKPKPNEPVKPAEHKKVDSKEFVPALDEAKKTNDPEKAWRVDTYRTAEDFDNEGIATYMTPGGSTFAIKPDGDIISVCKNQANEKKIKGEAIMAAAVECGGDHLDSFEGNFDFYTRCGFETVSRCKFDPNIDIPGWRKGIDGEEDVLFMRYVGVGNVQDADKESMKKRVPYSKDYGEAGEVLEKVLKEVKNNGRKNES